MTIGSQIKIAVLLVVYCSITGFAQQAPQYTQYMISRFDYNPAYAGSEEALVLQAGFRAQWVGLPGKPITQTAALHLPLPAVRSGVGLNVANDFAGFERNTGIYATYAYRQPIGKGTAVSIGLRAGVMQKKLKGNELISPEGIYGGGVIDHQDAFIPVGVEGGWVPDFGAGVFLKTRNLDVGLSMQHLLEPSIKLDTEDGSVEITHKRQFYADAGYQINIGKVLRLYPSVLFKTDLKAFQLDASALLSYNEFIHGGLSFRGFDPNSMDALAILGGINLKPNLLLMYSYDFNLSNLKSANTGSHELRLTYRLANIFVSKGGKIIHNPRFL